MVPRLELGNAGGPAGAPDGEPPKDLEPRPKVQVVFIGMNHSNFNLQGIAFTVDVLNRCFTNSPGRKVIFWEAANLTSADAGREIKVFTEGRQSQGWLRDHMEDELDREPKFFELLSRRQAIETSNFDEIIKRGFLPESLIFSYFISSRLEQNPWGAELRLETHTRDVVNRLIVTGDEVHNESGVTADYWQEGDFNNALDRHKRLCQNMLDYGESLRERDIVLDLKGLARNLMRSRDGGVIVVLFGNTHEGMIDDLQKKLGKGVSVAYTKILSTSGDNLDLRIVRAWRKKEHIPDELYAQQLLAITVLRFLTIYAQDSKNLTSFSQHYQDIADAVTQFANSFSLDEIRRICEEKQDVGELLRAHPLTQPIRQWLEF